MYQRILVPVDGGGTARRALQEAMRLGLAAQFRLIYVLDTLDFVNPEGYVDFVALHEVHQQNAARVLQEMIALVQSAGFVVEGEVLETEMGNVAETIDAEAVRWGAELIVMGTHGRSGLERWLLGSVAESVTRDAPVPVLLVRGEG